MAPRTRRAVQRLAEINEAASNEITTPLPITTIPKAHNKTRKSVTFEEPAPRKRAGPNYSNPNILFGPKSPLTKIDLATFFSDDKVWNGLSDEQKGILKAMCPKDCTWGKNSTEQPTLGLLLYDMHWKSDVRVYEENLKDGYCEPAWIEEAEEATSARSEGKFDDWKLKKFEEYWGQKMEEDESSVVAVRGARP